MTAESSAEAETPRPDRLRRLDQVFATSPIYFVTACTAHRRPYLNRPEVRQALIEFAHVGQDRGAWMGGYCLMPDHLHLFLRVDDERTKLSSFIKSLKNTLSKTLRTCGIPAPHWQKGFFDHVLRSDESYAQKWHYVRENPVRAGLVRDAADWIYQGEIHPLELRRS